MKINVKRDKNNYIVPDRVIAKNKILHVYTVEIDYLICITNIRCMIICIKFLIQLHDLLYDLLYIFFCTCTYFKEYNETRYTMRSLIVVKNHRQTMLRRGEPHV